eukprot:m.191681 g.191681  ORF g.191681 m.191681 type:complete len:148 (-) comp53641_c0_seq26:1065-1508(-)
MVFLALAFRKATGKMCYFQVVNAFFVTIIASSAFSQLDQLINSPTSIVSLMGTSVPGSNGFFVNFIMLQMLSGLPMQLLQLVPLIVNPILKSLFAVTPKEKRAVDGLLSCSPSSTRLCIIFISWPSRYLSDPSDLVSTSLPRLSLIC